jgi:steroid delta-isomerase-like uncharacterized protein/uncharacterized protein (TIGR02246 family)
MVVAGCEEKQKTPEGTGGAAASAAASSSAAVAAATAAPVKATPGEMASAFAKKLAEAWSARDAAKVAALFAPDATQQLSGDPEVHQGRAAIEKGTSERFARYKDSTMTVGRIWSSKSASVIEWVSGGTRLAGEIADTKVPEKPVGLVGAAVVTFDDTGLVKTDHSYVDIAANLGQVEPKLLPAGVKFRPLTTTLPAGTGTFESKGTPEEAKNLDSTNKVFAAVDSHKADEVIALLADDYVDEDFTMPGPLKKADVTPMEKEFFTAFPDIKTTSKTVQFAAGDYVVTEAVIEGTFKAALPASPGTPAFKPTNQPVKLHSLDVVQLKDGKIVKEWSYSNNAEFLSQIGVMKYPTKWSPTPGAQAAAVVPAAAPKPQQH